jgi:hypothetical protein
MSKIITVVTLSGLASATVPTHARAGEPAPEKGSAKPRKKSEFLSFARAIAEQVARQLLPRVAPNNMATMIKRRGDRAANAAANAMPSCAPTC